MFRVTVNNRKAWLTQSETITAGSAGLEVAFTFSDDWAGLSKFAVFVAYDRTVAVPMTEDTITIDPAVMKLSGIHLFVGVYGVNVAGTTIIPTLYCDLGMIYPGADPQSADNYADPDASLYAQTLALAKAAQLAAGIAASGTFAGAATFRIADNKNLMLDLTSDGVTSSTNLGPVTAYAAAVAGGSTETYAEFLAKMAAAYSTAEDIADIRETISEFRRILSQVFICDAVIPNLYINDGSTSTTVNSVNISEDSLCVVVPDKSPTGGYASASDLYISSQSTNQAVVTRASGSQGPAASFTLYVFHKGAVT